MNRINGSYEASNLDEVQMLVSEKSFPVCDNIILQNYARENHEKVGQTLLEPELIELGRKVYCILHDFRNLLTGMQGHLELGLLEDLSTSELKRHVNEALGILVDSSSLLSQLVLSQPEKFPTYVVIDLADAVSNAIAQTLPSFLPSSVDITVENFCSSCRILAIPADIDPLLANLLGNSLEAVREQDNAHIRISLWEVPDTVESKPFNKRRALRLTIEDNRRETSQEQLDQVIEDLALAQIKQDRSQRRPGMAQEIIRSHGGVLTMQSILGKSTQFRLHFPIYQKS